MYICIVIETHTHKTYYMITKDNNANYSLILELFLSDVIIGHFKGFSTYKWVENSDGIQYLIRMNADNNKVMKMWRNTNQDNWRFEKAIELGNYTIEEIALNEWQNFTSHNK